MRVPQGVKLRSAAIDCIREIWKLKVIFSELVNSPEEGRQAERVSCAAGTQEINDDTIRLQINSPCVPK